MTTAYPSDMSPAMRSGLARLSRDLGRFIETPDQRRRRETAQARRAVIWVECPSCGMGPGWSCRTASGRETTQSHRPRWAAVRAEVTQ